MRDDDYVGRARLVVLLGVITAERRRNVERFPVACRSSQRRELLRIAGAGERESPIVVCAERLEAMNATLPHAVVAKGDDHAGCTVALAETE